ncbi:NUDIX domain-containing protein [Streptomyces sp. NPDC048171]|uniref:NUDIX domain-containing protein n=1 Tax=Streptomyces sp. NPDC048171 TaxID=3365504 RepID=UPI003719ACFD
MTASPATEVGDASRLRHQLVQQLHAHNHIRSAAVEHAFRTVPRHVFAPEVPLPVSYADDIVPTCHDDGTITGSISAPWLQAEALACLIREAQEEAGLRIERRDVELVHVVHHIDRAGDRPRMGLFFRARAWSSEPELREPDKCTRWKFWDPAALPDDLVPYTRIAIEGIKNGELYSETGWPA